MTASPETTAQRRFPLLPPGTRAEARLVLWVRAIRAFGDGYVALLLPFYLATIGFDAFAIGIITTASLLGASLVTLGVGMAAARFRRRSLLSLAAGLMTITGFGYGAFTDFWPLFVVAVIGTLNPALGHSNLFLPLEHTVLAQAVPDRQRTALFARYALIGSLLSAIGALAAGAPQLLQALVGLGAKESLQAMFLLYGVGGVASWAIYRRIPPTAEPPQRSRAAPLVKSRQVIITLAALFGLDSFGGGFVVQSMVALWLFDRFGLSPAAVGNVFFWLSLLNAFSLLVAGPIARRIGLVRTMVFTHLPGNLLLVLVPFMPEAWMAVGLLLARSALSQIDVPARTSYVMAVVPPEERPAAASLTTVPRGLCSAVGPLAAGYLLSLSTFGWPMVIGGTLMGIYDLLLLRLFHAVKPPEEQKNAGPAPAED